MLREMLKRLPGEDYVYYSDNAWCPYGEKSPEFIIERCRSITDLMLERGAEAMVLACNTATAAAISSLRAEYDIPFVGMEPAIKPAVQSTRSGVVGVLATSGTLKGAKYLDTRERYAENVKVVENVGRGFVELVESGTVSGKRAEEVVRASLQPLLDQGADTIVLGCTHYPFLLDTMRSIAGPGVEFIDPAPAVARHLEEVLEKNGKCARNTTPGTVELLASDDDTALRRTFQLIY